MSRDGILHAEVGLGLGEEFGNYSRRKEMDATLNAQNSAVTDSCICGGDTLAHESTARCLLLSPPGLHVVEVVEAAGGWVVTPCTAC